MVTQNAALPARFQTGAQPADSEVEIHRGDVSIVALFLALRTQWHRHPMTGQRLGLDYSAVRPMADLASIDVTPATLPALQAMEEAALLTFAEAAR